jgi:hypothetical protein
VGKYFFAKLAAGAFPLAVQDVAGPAVKALSPFVDDSYRIGTTDAASIGDAVVQIPARFHFNQPPPARLDLDGEWQLAADCLASRSTDGYLRQAALRRILNAPQPWVIPFILLPAGEYVVEIAADLIAALPTLDRAIYSDFVRANRPLLRLLQSRATSYWNCYYRRDYRDKGRYPALAFLWEIESWAA